VDAATFGDVVGLEAGGRIDVESVGDGVGVATAAPDRSR